MTRLCTFGFDDSSEFLLGIPFDEGLASGQKVTGIGQIRRLPTNVVGVNNLGMLFIGNSAYWAYYFGSNVTDLYFAGSFYAQSLQNANVIVMFDTRTDGAFSSTLSVIWNSDGSISLKRGSTTLATSAVGLISTYTKYCIECYVKPRNSGGEFTVKIDGVQVATSGSADTTDNAESCDGFRLYAGNSVVSQWSFWDDVIANSNAEATNNTWVGRVFLWPIHATGAGDSTQLDRGGVDMGSNFAQVRDPDPGGMTFVQGDEDEIDLYTVDVPDIPAGATINNIIVQGVGKSTSGSGLIALLCKCGGTLGTGSDQTLTASPMIRQEIFAVCPDDSAAWAESDLSNGLQIGVQIRS